MHGLRLIIVVLLSGCLTAAVATSATARQAKTQSHRVHAGQTLGRIAKRYNVSIAALCDANGISRRSPIKPGQELIIPKAGAKNGSRAKKGKGRAQRERARKKQTANAERQRKRAAKKARAKATRKARVARPKATWRKYKRPARRAGYVTLKATGRSWKGYAIVKGNRVSGRAKKGFKRSLYSWRTGKESTIHPRLIRLLTKASDTFGGRTLRVASGYRERSHARDSKHKLGHACDFSIDGVPNKALRDYLLTIPGVGVGYYPNSSFVHLDVRSVKTQWTDHARSGQTPRYAHKR